MKLLTSGDKIHFRCEKDGKNKNNQQKSDCSHSFFKKFAANLSGLKGIGDLKGKFIYLSTMDSA